MSKSSQSRPRAPASVRIIGGKLRGRKLPFPSINGLRPTLGRTRETLFNWLTPQLPGASCLDLFAGTGALGLEALSRGAGSVVLVEQQKPVHQALRANIARLSLGAPQVQLVLDDGLAFLTRNPSPKPAFDLIFLDPPFAGELLPSALQCLASGEQLRPDGLLYYECAVDSGLETWPQFLQSRWHSVRHKRAGDYQYGLLQLA